MYKKQITENIIMLKEQYDWAEEVLAELNEDETELVLSYFNVNDDIITVLKMTFCDENVLFQEVDKYGIQKIKIKISKEG